MTEFVSVVSGGKKGGKHLHIFRLTDFPPHLWRCARLDIAGIRSVHSKIWLFLLNCSFVYRAASSPPLVCTQPSTGCPSSHCSAAAFFQVDLWWLAAELCVLWSRLSLSLHIQGLMSFFLGRLFLTNTENTPSMSFLFFLLFFFIKKNSLKS